MTESARTEWYRRNNKLRSQCPSQDRGIPRSTMEVEDGDDVLVVVVVA